MKNKIENEVFEKEQFTKKFIENAKYMHSNSTFSYDDVKDIIKITFQLTQEKCRANQHYENFIKVEEKIEHIIKWFKTKNRKPANMEWTSSPERQVGYIIENLEYKNNNIKQETAQSIFDDFDIIIQSIENDCLKLNPANDYEEGIRLNLQGVKIQLEELEKKHGVK